MSLYFIFPLLRYFHFIPFGPRYHSITLFVATSSTLLSHAQSRLLSQEKNLLPLVTYHNETFQLKILPSIAMLV